ncbi:hypothetical protein AQUCO_00600370v1 [Aquilegia coerulea]|uniref:F-box domain-containing protein n=1 Tax=Aquilegia coerulea TaxID=218851 RepID=A0A2G5EPD8_AQUCA|nr:hypothetical protein AQUCO_00600370v1 [Aquilegia coerulea]
MDDFFPDDFFYEILLRIPAKDLLRFKSVCKSWNLLISDKFFAIAHLSYSKLEILLALGQPKSQKNRVINFFTLNQQDNNLIKFALEDNQLLLKSACDGMVFLQCYHDCGKIFIYNWVTRQLKRLPPPPEDCSRFVLFLDDSIQKYKVFGIQQYTTAITTMECFMITQGDTDWRFVYSIASEDKGQVKGITCVEKELHWTARQDKFSTNYVLYLYSMDIASEEVAKVEIPFEMTNYHALGQVRGSLSIVSKCETHVEIRSLADKATNHWIIVCNIDVESIVSPLLSGEPKLSNWSRKLYQFAYMDDIDSDTYSDRMKILIPFEDRLYMYDMEKKDLSEIVIPSKIENLFIWRVLPRKSSLVNWE